MALDTEKRKAQEDFCKSLGWSIGGIGWFGLTGYYEISQALLAKIDMSDPGSQVFRRFHVTILNKNEGAIDGHTFQFDDYLEEQQEPKFGCIQVVAHDMGEDAGKFGWRNCGVKDTRPLTNAIEDYIAQFK